MSLVIQRLLQGIYLNLSRVFSQSPDVGDCPHLVDLNEPVNFLVYKRDLPRKFRNLLLVAGLYVQDLAFGVLVLFNPEVNLSLLGEALVFKGLVLPNKVLVVHEELLRGGCWGDSREVMHNVLLRRDCNHMIVY